MKFEDLTIGTQVMHVPAGREMRVTHLHTDDGSATCAFIGRNDAEGETRIPAHELELVRDGGMMDNA